MKYFLFVFITIITVNMAYAQPPRHGGHDSFKPDTLQKPQRGPNRGKMLRCNGFKIEMLTPANVKKQEVSYFVYDSLNTPLEARKYTGTVKYVFGTQNQYLEVNLIPSGKANQYVATLEDWKDFKTAIVTLKENGKVRSSVEFVNDIQQQKEEAREPSQIRQNNSGGMLNGNGMGR